MRTKTWHKILDIDPTIAGDTDWTVLISELPVIQMDCRHFINKEKKKLDYLLALRNATKFLFSDLD